MECIKIYLGVFTGDYLGNKTKNIFLFRIRTILLNDTDGSLILLGSDRYSGNRSIGCACTQLYKAGLLMQSSKIDCRDLIYATG